MSIPPHDRARFLLAVQGEHADAKNCSVAEELLNLYPALTLERLANGEPLLRHLLRNGCRRCFHFFRSHGAEDDIFTACAVKDTALIKQLLQQDATFVSATDETGKTPLHWACTNRFANGTRDEQRVVALLVEHGAKMETLDAYGVSPLRQSLLYGDEESAIFIMERGANSDLLFAVASEDMDDVDELLRLSPAEIHWRSPSSQSLLHFAIDREVSSEFLEGLLARGASEEIESRWHHYTPLLQAINFHPDAVETLVRHGADVNVRIVPQRSSQAETALDFAVRSDRPGAVELLLAAGARVHEQLSHAKTLLHHVKSREVAEMLLTAGLSVDAKDNDGQCPLDFAVEEGRRDVAQALIGYGARPNFFSFVVVGDFETVCDMLDADCSLISAFNPRYDPPLAHLDNNEASEFPWGSTSGTALHYAAKAGSLPMVKLLLERGADVNAARAEGDRWTPLHDAVYYSITNDLRDGHSIIQTLVAAGADLAAKTHGGYRPIEIAEFLSFHDGAAGIFDLLAALARSG